MAHTRRKFSEDETQVDILFNVNLGQLAIGIEFLVLLTLLSSSLPKDRLAGIDVMFIFPVASNLSSGKDD